MEEYFNSKKYIILLITVCLVFTIMISQFFEYLPKPINNDDLYDYNPTEYKNFDVNTQNNIKETTNDESSNIVDKEEDEEEDNNSEANNEVDLKHKSGHIDFSSNSYPNTNNFEEIPAPKGSAEEIVEAQ